MAGARTNALVAFVNNIQKYLWIDPTVVIRAEAVRCPALTTPYDTTRASCVDVRRSRTLKIEMQ